MNEFITRTHTEFILHICHNNCKGIPNVHLERIQAQRRVTVKRKLRKLGVFIPESAMFNLAFLQLLLRTSQNRIKAQRGGQ